MELTDLALNDNQSLMTISIEGVRGTGVAAGAGRRWEIRGGQDFVPQVGPECMRERSGWSSFV